MRREDIKLPADRICVSLAVSAFSSIAKMMLKVSCSAYEH